MVKGKLSLIILLYFLVWLYVCRDGVQWKHRTGRQVQTPFDWRTWPVTSPQ